MFKFLHKSKDHLIDFTFDHLSDELREFISNNMTDYFKDFNKILWHAKSQRMKIKITQNESLVFNNYSQLIKSLKNYIRDGYFIDLLENNIKLRNLDSNCRVDILQILESGVNNYCSMSIRKSQSKKFLGIISEYTMDIINFQFKLP